MCKGGISRKEGCPPKLICIQLLSVCFVSYCNNNNARNTGELLPRTEGGCCVATILSTHTQPRKRRAHMQCGLVAMSRFVGWLNTWMGNFVPLCGKNRSLSKLLVVVSKTRQPHESRQQSARGCFIRIRTKLRREFASQKVNKKRCLTMAMEQQGKCSIAINNNYNNCEENWSENQD